MVYWVNISLRKYFFLFIFQFIGPNFILQLISSFFNILDLSISPNFPSLFHGFSMYFPRARHYFLTGLGIIS